MTTISTGAGPSTTSGGLRPSPEQPVSLRSTRPRRGEKVVFALLVAAAAVSVLTTLGIVISLVLPAIQFFREVSILDFLTGTSWTPREAAIGRKMHITVLVPNRNASRTRGASVSSTSHSGMIGKNRNSKVRRTSLMRKGVTPR